MSTNYYFKVHIGKTYASEKGYTWVWDESMLSSDALAGILLSAKDYEFEDEYGKQMTQDEMASVIQRAVAHESSREPFS